MNAEIIAVGTELLLGQILNTNAQYLSKRLSELGIDVYYQTVVGDNAARLTEALECAFSRSAAVFITGGLGPTADDLTKETVSEYFGLKLILDEGSLSAMEQYFKNICRPMPLGNKKQAMIPEGAFILKNDAGTAPGCIIEKGGRYACLLPGPPKELVPMFENYARPYFKKFEGGGIYSRVLRVFGMGESEVGERLADMAKSLKNPTLAPYAKEGEVTVRVTAKAIDEGDANALIAPIDREIRKRLGDVVYGYGDDESLCGVVCKMLQERSMTLATAESCTGGLLAKNITDVAGASKIFEQGIVVYSNTAKIKYLGVSPESLNEHGAVSAQVAREMARGMRAAANSDIAIGITGIAGPGGGSAQKPVGLVYIALAHGGGAEDLRLNLSGSRERIRERAALYAFDMIRRHLLGL